MWSCLQNQGIWEAWASTGPWLAAGDTFLTNNPRNVTGSSTRESRRCLPKPLPRRHELPLIENRHFCSVAKPTPHDRSPSQNLSFVPSSLSPSYRITVTQACRNNATLNTRPTLPVYTNTRRPPAPRDRVNQPRLDRVAGPTSAHTTTSSVRTPAQRRSRADERRRGRLRAAGDRQDDRRVRPHTQTGPDAPRGEGWRRPQTDCSQN